jgi:DinB superfamily
MQTNNTELDLVVKMIISAWDAQNNQLNKLLNEFSDEQWQKEIAPGKNRGIYLLGHLIAVSDAMFPILGFQDRLFPALEPVFIFHPDKAGVDMPSIAELKEKLRVVNARMKDHIQSTTTAQWFERHMSVSPEDFAKEPHRNKLNIIINRTGHMAYHIGQLRLLK